VSRSWRAITAALALAAMAIGSNEAAFGSDDGALIGGFRTEFTSRNPVLTRIEVLESKPLSRQKGFSSYVYLVHAIRPDMHFAGKFEDEQFGVFLVNVEQNRIVKVLDVFNTPRWLDYDIKIKRASPSKVTVVGGGATYGDEPFTRTYDIGSIK
jgi:hypothetical protein